MDKELIAYLDERFRETSQQISQLREDMNGRLDRVEQEIRETQVLVEGLRGDVRQVAEGVIGLSERFESYKVDIARRFDDLEHKISPLYIDLNRRVTFLESWAEHKDEDAIELIRKKFGRPRES